MVPTLDEIIDELLLCADFEEVQSLVKANRFVTAAKRYLLLSPQSQADQGSSMTMSVVQIENLLRRAQEYVREQREDSGDVRFLSAGEGFR